MDYRTPLLAFPANAKHGTDAAAHLTGDLLPAPALNAQRSNPPSIHDALGRPKRIVDARRIAALRVQGWGWKKIAREVGCGVSTVLRVGREGEKRGSVIHAESPRGSVVLSPSV